MRNASSLQSLSSLLALMLFSPPAAEAQRTTPSTQRVEIRQSDHRITVKDHRDNTTSIVSVTPTEQTSVRIPAVVNTNTSIWIVDPNPLLYSYTWKDVKTVDSADYTAALEVATLLKGVAAQLPSLSAPMEDTDSAIAKAESNVKATGKALSEQVAIAASLEAIVKEEELQLRGTEQKLMSAKSSDRKLLGQSVLKQQSALLLRTRSLEQTRTEIARLTESLRRAEVRASEATRQNEMRTSLESSGLDDQWRRSLVTALNETSAMSERLPAILQQALADPEGAKKEAATRTAALAEHRKANEDGYAVVDKALPAVLTALRDGNADPGILAGLALLRTVESDAKEALRLLTSFQAEAAKIGVPILIGSVPYSATLSQTATMVIAKTASNPSKDPGAEGTYLLVIEPYSRHDISIAPAYIYSWVKDQPEASGQTLAAMVTVAFRQERSDTFVPGIHLGLSPKSKGLDFYLGASVKVSGLFHIGGGFSWTDIKDEGRQYKPGGYLLLSADLFKSKK